MNSRTTSRECINHAVRWVKLSKYVELTGDSVDAVQARRKAGKWLDGRHCKMVDGRLWVDLEAVQSWVELWGTANARPVHLDRR